MTFLTGEKLAAKLKEIRMLNKTSPMFNAFRGIGGRRSSFRQKPQNYKAAGSGEQECFRRRNGGFYDVRKRSMFP